MLDLTPDQLAVVKEILGRLVPGVPVWAFGSRVDGTAAKTSDLDLAVMTDAPLSLKAIGGLRDAFSSSDLPFRVDIVDWAAIGDEFRAVVRRAYEVIQ